MAKYTKLTIERVHGVTPVTLELLLENSVCEIRSTPHAIVCIKYSDETRREVAQQIAYPLANIVSVSITEED